MTKNIKLLLWIFNKTDGINDIATLKARVMAALRNADGTPIKELNTLFVDNKIRLKLQDVFGANVRTPNDLLNEIDAKFNKIFIISE